MPVRSQETQWHLLHRGHLPKWLVPAGPADTTPPVISNGQPAGTLPAGTTQTSMSVTTNENATCRWSNTAFTVYAAMTNAFATTGQTSHSATLTGLVNGQAYTRYVRCIDPAGNANTADYVISFPSRLRLLRRECSLSCEMASKCGRR